MNDPSSPRGGTRLPEVGRDSGEGGGEGEPALPQGTLITGFHEVCPGARAKKARFHAA